MSFSNLKTMLRNATAILALAMSASVFAGDLANAKAAGHIGERADGYIGVVNPPGSAEVRSLVEDVNAKRRSEYQRIAEKNGIELSEVELLAGRKTIEKTAPGGWIYVGKWKQK